MSVDVAELRTALQHVRNKCDCSGRPRVECLQALEAAARADAPTFGAVIEARIGLEAAESTYKTPTLRTVER